jgi:hypothetical protein
VVAPGCVVLVVECVVLVELVDDVVVPPGCVVDVLVGAVALVVLLDVLVVAPG